MSHQGPTEPLGFDAGVGEGLVEAAVAASEHRLEAQGWHRGDRPWRAQQGVAELEERIGPAEQAVVELGAEPDEHLRCAGPVRHLSSHSQAV